MLSCVKGAANLYNLCIYISKLPGSTKRIKISTSFELTILLPEISPKEEANGTDKTARVKCLIVLLQVTGRKHKIKDSKCIYQVFIKSHGFEEVLMTQRCA